MTTEAKTKKNTDYSASAVALLNPQEVEIGLIELNRLNIEAEKIKAEMDALIPQELKQRRDCNDAKTAEVTQVIKDRINSLGSYQNLEQGWYGVKQRKVSVSYDAGMFEGLYPQYAPAIIVKAVDATKLKGLIKGGLITEEELRKPWDGKCGASVAKENETFVYIIKA